MRHSRFRARKYRGFSMGRRTSLRARRKAVWSLPVLRPAQQKNSSVVIPVSTPKASARSASAWRRQACGLSFFEGPHRHVQTEQGHRRRTTRGGSTVVSWSSLSPTLTKPNHVGAQLELVLIRSPDALAWVGSDRRLRVYNPCRGTQHGWPQGSLTLWLIERLGSSASN